MTSSMTSPTKIMQPLGERSSNLPSPVKSPSKIPLPPSPVAQKKQIAQTEAHPAMFAEQDGAMEQMFKAPTLLEKPDLVRKIAEAHDAGQTYVSPSDDILSPTTKKLSEVKGRRFGNFKKSTSLYNAQRLFGKPAPGRKEDTSQNGGKP